MSEITLTEEELARVVYEDSEKYKLVKKEFVENWRHGQSFTGVIQDKETGKFYRINWRDSVKDTMMFSDMNYGPIECPEVVKKEKTVTYYE